MSLIKCPNCSEQVSDKAKVCPNCGSEIFKKQTEQANTTTCNKCGAEISQHFLYCPDCGCYIDRSAIRSNKKSHKKRFVIILSVVTVVVVGILTTLLVFMTNNKNICSFDWEVDQQTLESQMNQEFFGEDLEYNCISYKQKNIKFFENQKVIVLYYFSEEDDKLSRVIYDVSDNDYNSTNDFIEYLNKTCKKIEYGTKTIGNTKLVVGEWENDTTSISYESMGRGSNWIKFYFSPKE